MPNPKPLSREEILSAMSKTGSNKAAASYLHVSYNHYKKYAQIYFDEEGKSLWEIHKNVGGKGIGKISNTRSKRKLPSIINIIEGKTTVDSYTPARVKEALIKGGFLKEECYICGYKERRVIDNKIPILLNFKNGNKRDFNLTNIEFLCYNCYFINIGNIFNDKQEQTIEGHKVLFEGKTDWELNVPEVNENPEIELKQVQAILNAYNEQQKEEEDEYSYEDYYDSDGSEFIVKS